MAGLFEETITSQRSPWEPLQQPIIQGVQNMQQLYAQGPYGGPFAAPINGMQTTGINSGFNAAAGAGGVANTYQTYGQGLAPGLTQAFDYYRQSLGQPNNPLVTNPNPYMNLATMAANNPYMDASITAALRDPYRQLTEQQLPGIAMGAQQAGNAPSRRSILEGITRRGYEDRASDVGAQMRGQAWQTGLGMAGNAADRDQLFSQNSAMQLGNLGGQGLGYNAEGYNFNQLGAKDQAGWGNLQQGLDEKQVQANIQQYYEPWRLQDAYGQYVNPLATGLSSSAETRDAGTMGPMLNIIAQILAADAAGGGAGNGSIIGRGTDWIIDQIRGFFPGGGGGNDQGGVGF